MKLDTLSWAEMFCLATEKMGAKFGKALKVIKEKTKTKETTNTKERRHWGVTFVRGMSAFQIFLGFCGIVIALVGLTAAFDTKQRITRDAIDDLKYRMKEFYGGMLDNTIQTADKDRLDMKEFYERLFKNMTIIAKKERKALIEHCQNQTKNQALDNRNVDQSNTYTLDSAKEIQPGSSSSPSEVQERIALAYQAPRPGLYMPGIHPGSKLPGGIPDRQAYTGEKQFRTPHFDYESSPYLLFQNEQPPASNLPHHKYRYSDDCQTHLCYHDKIGEKVKEVLLIMDYLCVPAWTGIMYIITGLVGLRMMASKKTVEYLQVSHISTVLNFLGAVLFAPGMLAVGILQWHFGHSGIRYAEYSIYQVHSFRKVVGQITVGSAGACLLVSLVLCTVGCCCPVSSHLQDSFYKFQRLSESSWTLAEEKPRDEGISKSTKTLAEEKQCDEDKNEITTA